MKRPELGFAPRETAAGTYKFQAVVRHPSRTGTPMTKTLFPHAHLLSEQKVAQLGYDTRALIEKQQAQRVTVPNGEAERRREATRQVTLAGIDQREQKQMQKDIAYADETINATAWLDGERYGDPDAMFPGVYPNVVDQNRDFDIDPDRYERMFLRSEEYRLEQHNSRPARRAQHKAERQERRRELRSSSRSHRFATEEGRGSFDQWAIQQPMIREDAEREYRAMGKDYPEYFP